MKQRERVAIVETLPYVSRLAFVAFCVERCIGEARRHAAASAQLARLPHVADGLEMLWARAEGGASPNPERLAAIMPRMSDFEGPAPDGENMTYHYDVSVVNTASTLRKGMRLLLDPNMPARQVAGALDGPDLTMGAIYADYRYARDAEVAVLDVALERLRDLGPRPFSRDVFAQIPEWTRGQLSQKYAEGRLTGTDINQDD